MEELTAIKQRLLRIKPAIVPFLLGCALGWIITSQRLADPNSDWDTQAQTNLFCDRTELNRVPGHDEWSAVAYDLNCDLIGNSSVIYVYLLRPGQVISRSTLLVSYGGSAPELTWKDAKTLYVRAQEVYEVRKKVVTVADITVEYDFPKGF